MIAAKDKPEIKKRTRIKKKISLQAASLVLVLLAASGLSLATEERAVTAESGDKGSAMKTPPGDAGKALAATVNGVAITRESLMAMMNRMSSRKGEGDLQSRYEGDLKQKALDRLILQELAYQKAKENGMSADPIDVENALTNLKKKLGGEQEYDDFLKASDLSEDGLRSQLERAIMVDHIFTKEVFEHVVITEDETEKEYEKGKDTYVTPEKIVVTDVVFFLDTQDKASQRKAAEMLEKIKSEENKDPWKLAPDSTFAVRTLEVKKDEEKTLYEEAIKLQPGELSGVVITPDSLHIIKLKEYVPSKQLTFDEVKGALKAGLRKEAQKNRLREWETELRKNAKIEILDAKGSEK